IEVESIEKFSIPDNVVAAEIKEQLPHPNADKLSICKVWDGSREYNIVCGAPNCNSGKIVALAKEGSILTNRKTGQKITITKRELRGVLSEGMLCSGEELGLEEKSDGIIELPEDTVIGTPLSEIFPSDVIFDLEITPNRPDLLSHIGLARDIAAIYSLDIIMPKTAIFAKTPEKDFSKTVSVLCHELCPRYTARIIRGVKIAESPIWLKERLRKIGLRPINNVVDITNYVLFETGQPLHAFDLKLLKGEKVIVRKAFKGEKITTLDGNEHELDESILLICDEEKPVALAGIMGGMNSGVNENTTDILIESAYFEPSNIRASSRRLAISSDSSYHFERGVDIEAVHFASNRAASLILELAGGEISSELIDIRSRIESEIKIKCRYEKIRMLLGITEITNDEISAILKRLNCKIISEDKDSAIIIPPSYRLDLFNEADLAEEVLRIHGISQIPIETPRAICGGLIEDDSYVKIESFRNSLVELGLTECMNYSFFEKKAAILDPRFNENNIVPISNPLSKDSEFMRPSLLYGMLQTINRNISKNASDLALFEMGKVFYKEANLNKEKLELIIVLSGRKHPERFSSEKNILYDFYDMKGLIESIMQINKVKNWSFIKFPDAVDYRQSAEIFSEHRLAVKVDNEVLVIFGELSKKYKKDFRTKSPIYIAIFDLSALLASKKIETIFKPYSQFPSIRRDIALESDISLENSVIIDFINKQNVKYLEKFEIFDLFIDESLGRNKKSLAYSFYYRSMDKTLTDEEVNEIHDALRAKIAKELPVQIR
ncbi:MAG TPA: phenylalanine--tRNA ligase subunit beta, partial [Victivallales bacterium]|nr:phenylalanine--tRNA ligase subunit beta [Victivallales bacterium]